MIKYYFGQFCKWIGFFFLPGLIIVIVRRFFFEYSIPIILTFLQKGSISGLGDIVHLYLALAIIISHVCFAIYLIIRHSIYKKHWNEAYKKQLSGRYKKDHSLWDDSKWDRP